MTQMISRHLSDLPLLTAIQTWLLSLLSLPSNDPSPRFLRYLRGIVLIETVVSDSSRHFESIASLVSRQLPLATLTCCDEVWSRNRFIFS